MLGGIPKDASNAPLYTRFEPVQSIATVSSETSCATTVFMDSYFRHYHIHSSFISQGLLSTVFLLMKNTALFVCCSELPYMTDQAHCPSVYLVHVILSEMSKRRETGT